MGSNFPLQVVQPFLMKNRFKEGLKVQKEIFGADNIDAMRVKVSDDEKQIQDYLSANCFGDYYTRKYLDLKTREVLTFAMLISLGGCEAQVKDTLVVI